MNMSPELHQSEKAHKSSTVKALDELSEQDKFLQQDIKTDVEELGTDFTYKYQLVWTNVIGLAIYHIIGIYGLYIKFTFRTHVLTFIYMWVIGLLGGLGISMGVHRYFSHGCFKANLTLRRILFLLFILNAQMPIYDWIRQHRQHHKYCDTDADPHNASRGFFFSHIGWLMSRKHPKVIQYGKGIDMSDMEVDSWVMFQKKHPYIIYFATALLPCIIPIVVWNEDPLKSLLVCFFARTTLSHNFTASVNSFTHIYGTRPYDKNILPTQNKFVDWVTFGDGWHNFHHAFPWDYRSAEFGMNSSWSTTMIEYCAKKGWAYDLKTAPVESIRNRIKKTGDNSHFKYGDPKKYEGVETWMNVWKSPKNPTYSSKSKPNPIKIKRQYVLYESDSENGS